MQTALYSYNTGNYFSTAARALSWIASVWALFAVLDGSFFAWLVLPAGLMTQFTHYRTEFDLEAKKYREGVRIGSITMGKWLPLAGMDFLYLKQNSYKQVSESRGSMSTFKFMKFDGYLKLSDNVKLHLLQRKTKEEALRDMEIVARDLQVELRDLTEVKIW